MLLIMDIISKERDFNFHSLSIYKKLFLYITKVILLKTIKRDASFCVYYAICLFLQYYHLTLIDIVAIGCDTTLGKAQTSNTQAKSVIYNGEQNFVHVFAECTVYCIKAQLCLINVVTFLVSELTLYLISQTSLIYCCLRQNPKTLTGPNVTYLNGSFVVYLI